MMLTLSYLLNWCLYIHLLYQEFLKIFFFLKIITLVRFIFNS